jgi:dihydroorotate dehydrogenase
MGFNNDGHDRVLARLQARRQAGGIIAVNLGANRDSPDRVADYVEGLRCFAEVASYVTVNVSSPNTPGLRALQSPDELERLLASLIAVRQGLRPIPLVLKLAPDLIAEELRDIAGLCVRMGVDAIAISNTTIARPPLRSPLKTQAGGLSGKPLFKLATLQLARLRLLTEGAIPLIGIGGISDAATAWAKVEAGASLLQLYSALVFKGPDLVRDILDGIGRMAAEKGFVRLSDAVGNRAEAFVHHGLAGT